jgi:DNA-binding transcriptional MerR regulator
MSSALLKVAPRKVHVVEGMVIPQGEYAVLEALQILNRHGVQVTRRALQWYATRRLVDPPIRRGRQVYYPASLLEETLWVKTLQAYYGLRLRDLLQIRRLGVSYRAVAIGAYLLERKLERYRIYWEDRRVGREKLRDPLQEAVFPVQSLSGVFPRIVGVRRVILNEYFRLVLGGADPEAIDLRREGLQLEPPGRR